VYFPILDRIADGYFDDSTNDEQLYNRFLRLLRSDNLITDPESLSSINLALSIRNAAPRVEAHYHYYTNKILPSPEGRRCKTWIELAGKQYCDPELKGEGHAVDGIVSQDLPFDRTLGPDSASVVATLYADITAGDFRKFHKTAVQSVRDGKSRYRIRHRPSTESRRDPLVMSGYGVELALKRTDYIVIDDRQSAGDGDKGRTSSSKDDSIDEELEDLTPLSASQLSELGVKAAGFVANSESPFDALLKVTQDFPKHSAVLAKQDPSAEFLQEHNENRATFLPEGYNVMWVNGIQYDPRKMDVFSMLDHLRRERRFVQSFRDMGLTSAEAIKLLSHPSIFEANTKTGAQRYDWRDENEGGDVIIWLNNIEKDRRYKDWPGDLFAVWLLLSPPFAVLMVCSSFSARSPDRCQTFVAISTTPLLHLTLPIPSLCVCLSTPYRGLSKDGSLYDGGLSRCLQPLKARSRPESSTIFRIHMAWFQSSIICRR
jgi:UDP-glucose:glycoprotein glucosyltransferase